MNFSSPRVLAIPLFILLAVAAVSAGGGWLPLFNGKDLSGWRAEGKEKWTVRDGAILGEATTDKYGYLVTEKSYRDFELRLKFKCDAPGNYGVFIRSRMKGEGKWGPGIEGLQVEIDPARDTAGIYETSGREWIVKPSPEAQRAMKPFEWNKLEIAVRGPHIVTRLNGRPMVDFHDPEPRFYDGVIGLQLHSGGGVKIHFKNIYIKTQDK